MKVDDAKAFRSKDIKKELSETGVTLKFGTPYVHTSVGTVERHFRTLQNYVTPFLIDLEHPGMTLTTVVKDLTGKLVVSNTKLPKEIEAFESSRQWGSSRKLQDLRRYVNYCSKMSRTPKPEVRKFVAEKTRARKEWNSEYQDKLLLVTNESKHTVTVGNRTLHTKDVAEGPEELVPKLFQPRRKNIQPTKLRKYRTGQKKTVYKEDIKLAKKNTAYQVDTLGEEKTTAWRFLILAFLGVSRANCPNAWQK